jgi:hypothetical protein
VATVNFVSPFEVLTRTLTLRSGDRKPPPLGPPVAVAAVHLSPAADEAGLPPIINGSGLRARNKDGLMAHDSVRTNMWLGAWTKDLSIEFELPEATPLAAIQVWNYNGQWQTAKGIRAADVAVSSDGSNWQTVLRGAEFAEADGTADYDEPTVLKLEGVATRKVRFENIVPLSASGKVGLSEVVFHRAGSATELSQPPSAK